MSSLLQEVAKAAKFKLLISDDVHEVAGKITLVGRVSPENVIMRLSGSHVVCGRIGKDTFLLVRAPSPVSILRVPNLTVERKQAEKQENPNWTPFNFNGSQFFYVPAANTGKILQQ